MKLKLSLFDKEEAVLSEERKVQAVPGETDVSFSMTIDQVNAWSAEYPYLYDVIMELEENGTSVEIYGVKCGFRTICLKMVCFISMALL